MTMTTDEAMNRARVEFAKYQLLFLEQERLNPDLSFDEVQVLVDYDHPIFEDEEDQASYDTAAMIVAFEVIMSVL